NSFELVEYGRPAAFFDFIAKVEIDHVSAADAHSFLADLEDFTRGDITRDDVAVLGIFFFEEVVTLVFGDAVGRCAGERMRLPGVAFLDGWHADASALAARGFGDQAALVFAGDGGGVHLHHLGISKLRARLITARSSTTGADDRHRALAEDQAISAG